jgi:hypothetical protein
VRWAARSWIAGAPGWRGRLGAAAALAVIGVLLTVPAARPAAAPAGPVTLADVWSGARPVVLAATLPTGDVYTPLLVLDATTSLGLTSRPGAQSSLLVLLTDPARPRPLQTLSPGTGDTLEAVAATSDRVYWLRSVDGSGGGPEQASIWTARRDGGPAQPLTTTAGPATTSGSQFDLQVADGRLYWTTAPPGPVPTTELRSIALSGGPVRVQAFPGSYGLTTWPWLTTTLGGIGGVNELRDAVTGRRVPVPTGPADQPICTPTRCRFQTSSGSGTRIAYARPDGSDGQVVPADAGTPAMADVALLDRFGVLTAPTSTDVNSALQRLVLDDLTGNRQVTVDTGVTRVGGYGAWLWWSTGDQETLTWHLLDLSTLR